VLVIGSSEIKNNTIIIKADNEEKNRVISLAELSTLFA
jgi:hypothetical protein